MTGRIDKDLFGSTLQILGSTVIDTSKNLEVKNATIKGELHVTDPAIGNWIGVAPDPTPQYIQFQVNPGGHLIFNSSIDVGQAYSTAPFGGALTMGIGHWKVVGNKQYVTRQTQLILDKDLTPGNEHVMIPSVRIVVDGTFTLSNDLHTIDGTFTVKGYLFTDYDLENILFTVPSRTYTCSRLPSL